MEKDILKKDISKLSTKDKVIFTCIIVIFIALIAVGIILINKKNDKDELDKIEKNKVVEVWKDSTIVEFNQDKDTEYYEYCISTVKDNKDCVWSRTNETTLSINNNGHRYVYYKLIDKKSKVIKEYMEEVFIDNTVPVINKIEVLEEDKLTIRVDAIDNVSSIDKYYYSMDNENYTEGTMTYVLNELDKTKEYTIYVKVLDKAGNVATSSIKINNGLKEEVNNTPVLDEPSNMVAVKCPDEYTYREDTNKCFKDIPMSSEECTNQGGEIYTSIDGVDTCTLYMEPISE